MKTTKASMRIGIVELPSAGWSAGASYTRMLVHSLGHACQGTSADLAVLTQTGEYQVPQGLEVEALKWEEEAPRRFRGEQRLRRMLRLTQEAESYSRTAKRHDISVLLPLWHLPAAVPDVKTIGWIADFQFAYLPEFFSKEELQQREDTVRAVADNADTVMLSSQNALDHYEEYFPGLANKGRVIPFPSLFAFEPVSGEAPDTLSRYHLPSKFALVANQFWQHKNHLVVVEAVKQLRQMGIQVPVIMTGMPADARDPQNRVMSNLLQAIAAAGLSGQVIVLGQVAYPDLLQLMRSAAVIIQPSRFEGWSTVVQDAKALGKPLLCSDLAVHREQATGALGFFPVDAPEILADLLHKYWTDLKPGVDLAAEANAIQKEREFAKQHGQNLLAACAETCNVSTGVSAS